MHAHCAETKPLIQLDEILHVGSHPHANFGHDQLKGLWVVVDQSLLFCLYIRRHPYKHLSTTMVSVNLGSFFVCMYLHQRLRIHLCEVLLAFLRKH